MQTTRSQYSGRLGWLATAASRRATGSRVSVGAAAVTPEEFAEDHGLSLEEAQLILEKRNRQATVEFLHSQGAPGFDLEARVNRLKLAQEALRVAQRKAGVHPVAVAGSEVTRGYDEEADGNLERFYSTKGSQPLTPKKPLAVAAEDVSQDPKDWK